MRLIDADKLLYDDEKFSDGKIYMVVHAPQIDNAPTAYDVDSVIRCIQERLQERMEYYGNEENIEVKIYKDVLEIVKSGGVSDE